MDQAAGLRAWLAGSEKPPVSRQVSPVPDHVVEALAAMALSRDTAKTDRVPESEREPKPAVTGIGSTGTGSAVDGAAPTAHTPVPTAHTPVPTAYTLMVVGATGSEAAQVSRVRGWLSQWRGAGSSWVGDPDSWRVVPVAADDPQLYRLAVSEPRWGLWVEEGPAAFRQAFAALAQVAERGGPGRMLALHPPGQLRKGLLQNLQQAAEVYFGIELLVLAR